MMTSRGRWWRFLSTLDDEQRRAAIGRREAIRDRRYRAEFEHGINNVDSLHARAMFLANIAILNAWQADFTSRDFWIGAARSHLDRARRLRVFRDPRAWYC